MQTDWILLIGLIALMALFLIIKRKNVKVEKIISITRGPKILERIFFIFRYDITSGLHILENIGKRLRESRALKYVVFAIILLSLSGMAFLIITLIKSLFTQIFAPESLPMGSIALVLPIKTATQVYIPFMYWIISIVVLMAVHEFSHGVMAAVYNVKIKSWGFGFLCLFNIPVIPLAFVDLNMKELLSLPTKKKLAVAGAGPVSNVIFAALMVVLLVFAVNPLLEGKVQSNGLVIEGLTEGGWAQAAGLKEGEIITEIGSGSDTFKITGKSDLDNSKQVLIGREITLKTDKGSYNGILGEQLGVMVKENIIALSGLLAVLMWVGVLIYYMAFLNLGIGLMNLLPASILDGGLIMNSLYERVMSKKNVKMATGLTTFVFLMLIVALFIFK